MKVLFKITIILLQITLLPAIAIAARLSAWIVTSMLCGFQKNKIGGIFGLLQTMITKIILFYETNEESIDLINDKIFKNITSLLLRLALICLEIIILAPVAAAAWLIGLIAVFFIEEILFEVDWMCDMLADFQKNSRITDAQISIKAIVYLLTKITVMLLELCILSPLMILTMLLTFTIVLQGLRSIIAGINVIFNQLLSFNTQIDVTDLHTALDNIIKIFFKLIVLMLKMILLVPFLLLGLAASVIIIPGLSVLFLSIKLICNIIKDIQTKIKIKEVHKTTDMIVDVFISIGYILLAIMAFAIVIFFTWKLILGGLVCMFIFLGLITVLLLYIEIAFVENLEMRKILSAIKRIQKMLWRLMLLALFIAIISPIFFAAAIGIAIIWGSMILITNAINGIKECLQSTKTINMKTIQKFAKTVLLIGLIALILTALGVILIPLVAISVVLLLGLVVMAGALALISVIIGLIKGLAKIMDKDIFKNVCDIMILIGLIAFISIEFFVLGNIMKYLTPLAIHLLLGLVVVAGALLLLMAIVFLIPKLIDVIDKSKNIYADIGRLLLVLPLIALMTAEFVILGILTSLLIPVGLDLIIGLVIMAVALLGIMLIVKGITWSMDNFGKGLLKNMLLFILVMVLMIVVTGALLIIGTMLAVLHEVLEPIEFEPILWFLLGLLGFAVVIGLVGYAMSAASAILLPAVAGIILFVGILIIVTGAILLIAVLLNELSSIVLDPEAIAEVVTKVFNTAEYVINAIFKKPEDKTNGESEDEPWWKSVLNFLGNNALAKLFKALMTMVYLAQILASIYLIKWIADCLNQIQDIELKETDIQNGVGIIFRTAEYVITSINKQSDIKGIKDAQNKLSKFEQITQILTNIHNILNTLSNQNYKTDQVSDLINIIGLLNEKFSDADSEKIVKALTGYENFLKRVDSTNLKKLEAASKLFEQMARFSESINGNFEQLAETLNEKIAPLMEELKELLDGVQKKVEKNGSDISSSVFASVRNRFSGLSKDDMDEQIKREMPWATIEERAKITQQRMEEQLRQQSSNLTSKLDELIELFRGGQAQVKMS